MREKKSKRERMKHYEKICVKFYLFSRKDRHDLEALAKAAGMKVGTYVRFLVLEASKKSKAERAAGKHKTNGNGEAA